MTLAVRPGSAAAVVPPLALLDSETSLRALVRAARFGRVVCDAAGCILDANAAFAHLVGALSTAELVGTPLAQFLVDPDRRTLALAGLVADGAPVTRELWVIRPDAELRAVHETAYLCVDAGSGRTFEHALFVDVTHQRAIETQLIELSTRDALTGCYNRRYLDELATALTGQCDARWGCVFVDLDHFKQYNDQHGHDAGDTALVGLSRFLMREVRAENAVVRYGGDEFVIVFSGASAEQTERVARRLQLAAQTVAPVPFTIGWAARVGDESLGATVARADQGLLALRVVDRSPERQRRVDEWVKRIGQ